MGYERVEDIDHQEMECIVDEPEQQGGDDKVEVMDEEGSSRKQRGKRGGRKKRGRMGEQLCSLESKQLSIGETSEETLTLCLKPRGIGKRSAPDKVAKELSRCLNEVCHSFHTPSFPPPLTPPSPLHLFLLLLFLLSTTQIKHVLVLDVVNVLGVEKSLELFNKTVAIQEQGGELTADGTRRYSIFRILHYLFKCVGVKAPHCIFFTMNKHSC